MSKEERWIKDEKVIIKEKSFDCWKLKWRESHRKCNGTKANMTNESKYESVSSNGEIWSKWYSVFRCSCSMSIVHARRHCSDLSRSTKSDTMYAPEKHCVMLFTHLFLYINRVSAISCIRISFIVCSTIDGKSYSTTCNDDWTLNTPYTTNSITVPM